MGVNIEDYTTEEINQDTWNIDTVSTYEAIKMINREDHKIAAAVEKEIPVIAEAVDKIVAQLEKGGRMIYIGGGLSGRIGILDSSEVAPSFRTPYEMVQGLIAGGSEAIYKVLTGVEDDTEQVKNDLLEIGLKASDTVIGLSASGGTPYVVSGLSFAKEYRCLSIGVVNNSNSRIAEVADLTINVIVGPEAITGSTRMKAGTAQKMVVNMLSTGVMIKLGRVYKNLLIFVEISNDKLFERVIRAFRAASNTDEKTASEYLKKADNNAALALVMWKFKIGSDEAREILKRANGNIQLAMQNKTSDANTIIFE